MIPQASIHVESATRQTGAVRPGTASGLKMAWLVRNYTLLQGDFILGLRPIAHRINPVPAASTEPTVAAAPTLPRMLSGPDTKPVFHPFPVFA
jgi:hypothetical protein